MEDENCKHEIFQVNANLNRLVAADNMEKITGYAADIRINCTQCGRAFEWIGVPMGLSPSFPCISADGLELRAPLRPSDQPIEKKVNTIYN